MARCRWHFGGGPEYCGACPLPCDVCPYRQHEPLSLEGWQAWDVALKTASQLRAVPGAAIGLDLAACLRVGRALGYDESALAELLPAAETGLIEGLNRRLADRTPDSPQNR
jgi:hypothetical protein